MNPVFVAVDVMVIPGMAPGRLVVLDSETVRALVDEVRRLSSRSSPLEQAVKP